MRTTIRLLAVFVLLIVAARFSLRALPRPQNDSHSRPTYVERTAADLAGKIGWQADWVLEIEVREIVYQIDQSYKRLKFDRNSHPGLEVWEKDGESVAREFEKAISDFKARAQDRAQSK